MLRGVKNLVHQLTFKQYQKMQDLIKAFKNSRNRLPNYVDIAGYRITQEQFLDMEKRVENYKKSSGVYPGNIGIEGPIESQQEKSDLKTRLEAAVGGPFNTATEFYNRVKSESYGHYVNDIYPQGKAIERLKSNKSLNCSDFAQIGYAAIQSLNQTGKNYQAKYAHLKCTREGHIILQVKGEELGNNWVNYDLAEAASGKKPLGTVMCQHYKIISYNDPWLMSDDGET